MLTAAVVTAALFAAQAPATTINVPDSGQIVAVGAFHPKQLLGEHTFPGGVTSNRRNAIKAYGKPDSKSPSGCPNKWKALGVRIVTADFGGGPACAGGTPVQQLVITGRQWTTERGLKIGDSLDRVRELYPELKRFNDLYGKNSLCALHVGAGARGIPGRRPAERHRPPLRRDPRPEGSLDSRCRPTARVTSFPG